MNILSIIFSFLLFCVSLSQQSIEIHKKNHPSFRIHGGQQAAEHKFPYLVSLRDVKRYDYDRIDYNHFCGGAIISSQWIVSAAHCMHGRRLNASNIVAYAGAYHIWRDGKMYDIRRIHQHPDFNWDLNLNDISLLKTRSSIAFNNRVKPISISQAYIDAGNKLWFAGWGVTENDLTPFYLKQIQLLAIGNDECKRAHEPKYQMLVYNTTLCTFIGYNNGTCLGDSGGPLELDGKLVGILSWGIQPCATGTPEHFTRLSFYTNWIQQKTRVAAI